MVSLNFRQAAYAPETGRVLIALITIAHESLSQPIRISTDPTQRLPDLTTDAEVVYGTISRGQTYIFLPVRIGLPSDTDEGPGAMIIEIDNVHRQYTRTIREISSPLAMTVELVMDNALGTVEATWPAFLLTDIRYDDTTIRGTLWLETLEKEPCPAGSFSPAYFPGLF
jgi:hypothetical protein